MSLFKISIRFSIAFLIGTDGYNATTYITIYSAECLEQEIEFITNVFVENGYERKVLENIVKDQGKTNQKPKQKKEKYVSLPWIPGLSTKLRKVFKNIEHKQINVT